MYRTTLVLLVAAACSGGGKAAKENPAPAPVPANPAPAPEPAPAPAPAAQTPDELYQSCVERVEGKQADAECKADADCAPAGCSKEVCVTAAEAANVMTACDKLPCFAVLDACGCHEGKCTWTLKAEVPPAAPTPGGSLPSSLPPTTPPAPK